MAGLNAPAVARVLDQLHARAERDDPLAKRRVAEREAELGGRLPQAERYELYGDAPLAIAREVGELLYLLTRVRRSRLVVEFGCSLALSTIYLAAAVRDGEAGGVVVTTELLAEKASAARGNLAAAGLDGLVDLRVGDARETLVDLPGEVDVLFLDGRNDLYLPVLAVVEPNLAPDALLVADLNRDDPDLEPYLEYVRDPDSGYQSLAVPMADGVELSVRV